MHIHLFNCLGWVGCGLPVLPFVVLLAFGSLGVQGQGASRDARRRVTPERLGQEGCGAQVLSLFVFLAFGSLGVGLRAFGHSLVSLNSGRGFEPPRFEG